MSAVTDAEVEAASNAYTAAAGERFHDQRVQIRAALEAAASARPAVSGDAAEADALVAELREPARCGRTGHDRCHAQRMRAADLIEDLQRRLAASEKCVAELEAIEKRADEVCNTPLNCDAAEAGLYIRHGVTTSNA